MIVVVDAPILWRRTAEGFRDHREGRGHLEPRVEDHVVGVGRVEDDLFLPPQGSVAARVFQPDG